MTDTSTNTNTSTSTSTSPASTNEAAAPASSAVLPQTELIDVAQLRQIIGEDPSIRVLDVRTGGEFDSVHIPGSYNVPLDTLGEHVKEFADLDHPVVLVCKSGARADQAHGALLGAGKQRLHLLDGGLDAWVAAGGDVVRGNSETWAMDRQVRLVAGSISLAGIVASTVAPKAKWVAGFIGAGLTFSAVSNTCAMANMLGKLPYNKGRGCDIDAVLEQMRSAS